MQAPLRAVPPTADLLDLLCTVSHLFAHPGPPVAIYPDADGLAVLDTGSTCFGTDRAWHGPPLLIQTDAAGRIVAHTGPLDAVLHALPPRSTSQSGLDIDAVDRQLAAGLDTSLGAGEP